MVYMATVRRLTIRLKENEASAEGADCPLPQQSASLFYMLVYRLLKVIAIMLTCVIALEVLVFHYAIYALLALAAGGLILHLGRWLWQLIG